MGVDQGPHRLVGIVLSPAASAPDSGEMQSTIITSSRLTMTAELADVHHRADGAVDAGNDLGEFVGVVAWRLRVKHRAVTAIPPSARARRMRVMRPEYREDGSGFRVQGSGSRFRVQGSG
jgi:hypothetical protein